MIIKPVELYSGCVKSLFSESVDINLSFHKNQEAPALCALRTSEKEAERIFLVEERNFVSCPDARRYVKKFHERIRLIPWHVQKIGKILHLRLYCFSLMLGGVCQFHGYIHRRNSLLSSHFFTNSFNCKLEVKRSDSPP